MNSRAEKRRRVADLKQEANGPKHQLLRLLDQLEQVSAPEARRLGRIIGKLETWQNTGLGS